MAHMDAKELIREDDLEIWVSFGFIMKGSQRSFIELRELIEEYFESKKGEDLVHGTASSTKLFIVKEKDYEQIKGY